MSVGDGAAGRCGSVPVSPADLAAGARNLVTGCAEIRAGQRVLIVAEDPALGWFDADAPNAVAAAARHAGADVSTMRVAGPDASPPDLAGRVERADVAIFFARLGDRDRFVDRGGDTVRVVSYARTARSLASEFGRRDHRRMLDLKIAVDGALAAGSRIEITCPLGTRLSGPGPDHAGDTADVAVRRFPMCVPAPVCAGGFSGEVAVAGHLTPTGSRVYDPPHVALPDVVIAEVDRGTIAGFRGPRESVRRVEAHYAMIAERFAIRPDVVHSWHAGLHDACDVHATAADDPDLWSNTVFGSPRYLHFHTCGDYAPGEVCWMVEAPTIVADGRAIWRHGALVGLDPV